MKALIDGDILVYRVGYTTENEEEWVAHARIDELLHNISEAVYADEIKIFLTSTDHSNYRYQIFPEYKGQRKQPKPKWYNEIREYLEGTHDAIVVYGEEADDALGYSQDVSSIICSIDKDLLMIPGKHYNFVKGEIYNITPQEGLCNFYGQLLLGDTTDNIPGCPGVGKKKIEKVLNPDMSEFEMFETVKNLYILQYEKKNMETDPLEDMLRNGRLLKIREKVNEPLWEFPIAMD